MFEIFSMWFEPPFIPEMLLVAHYASHRWLPGYAKTVDRLILVGKGAMICYTLYGLLA